MLRPSLLLLRVALPPAMAVGGVAWLLGGLGTFAQAVLTLALIPDPRALVCLGGASILAALGIAVPAAALAGLCAGARRLAEDGAWLGLGTLGVAGRHLLPGTLVWSLAAGLAWGAVTHLVEPRARATLRDGRAEAAAQFAPLPARTLALGPWAVALDGERLRFAGGDWRGSATAWRLDAAKGAVVARLEGVEAVDLAGRRVTATRVEVAIPVDGGGGRHVSELGTAELRARIAASPSAERSTYERWILLKRSLLPALLAGFAPGGLALGLGPRRPAATRAPVGLVVGAQALALWGTMRACDQAIAGLGPTLAGSLLAGVALAWTLLPWATWTER